MGITKQCNTCGTKKPLEEFTKNKKCKCGREGTCSCCTKKRLKEYYQKNKIIDVQSKKNELNGLRKCRICGDIKSFDVFRKDKNGKYGITSTCHVCNNKYSKDLKIKLYNKKNREKIKNESKKERKCTKCGKVKHFDFFQKDKGCKYGIRNVCIECFNAEQKEYNSRNKENRNKWCRDKRETNPQYKLSCSLRVMIIKKLKAKNLRKTDKAIELLGCSIEHVKNHLESQFTEGMSWDNHTFYGWHIDHIRPCASFDLTNVDQQKECFCYKNLQPLWWYDNLKKSDKWDGAKNVT